MTEIVSHRGGALLWPENSLLAVSNSIGLGVDQVQLDIHPSRDGRIVVMHDGTLDRTAEGTGRVDAQDWSALSAIALKNSDGQRVPSLDDAIAVMRDSNVVLRIEIKRDGSGAPYPSLPVALGACLRRGGITARTILTSFSVEAVVAAAAYAPDARTGLLTNAAMPERSGLDGVIESVVSNRMESLGLRWDTLTPDIVRKLRAAGLKVGAFACNDTASINHALALGADEIMTDRPDLTLELRRAS